ncbi:unnamed protein product [Paramecium sonneborni]|uniref:Uncharacterized protein n=1 Tax=Paramecium sonneborni TaxID=65129 RepID=A0A8S1MTE1_9CILI|nr:unnamed protein product [Paramecium sonneborni]
MINQFYPQYQQQNCLEHETEKLGYIYYKIDEEIVQYYCTKCLSENEELSHKVQPISKIILEIEAMLLIKRSSILNELKKMKTEIEKYKQNILDILLKWQHAVIEIEQMTKTYQFDEQVIVLFSQNQFNTNLEDSHFRIKIEQEIDNQVSKIQYQLDQIRISLIKFNQLISVNNYLQQNYENQFYKLMGEQEQCDYACGIELNHQNDIMVASCESVIKIWQLEKSQIGNSYKLNQIQTLNQHTKRILCSVYSKKINWFATSGCDGKVFCFKLIDNQWVASAPVIHHESSVYCMILNKNEDRLISGGFEKKIVVWKINQDQNTINFDQVLQECKGFIQSIAINVLDTYLISSDIDCTLNLWEKNMQTSKYNFLQKYILNQNSNVYRITFLENNEFAIQYEHKDIISIFQIKNSQIIQKQKFDLNLNVKNFDGDYLFPSIYHQKKKILVQKFNRYIFIIKRFNNGMFKIIQIIDCQDSFNYGTLSNDGNILIVWDLHSKKFKIYSILMNENNSLFESYGYISIEQTKIRETRENRENRQNSEIRI